ncbi:hypothetical protein LJC04_03245 [Ruminococcaceae bacterium OttesenSCG-928-O06]|nr:hypothetical protein [Ruminococcaceae bacterium OttesenSCG-928-O06]
MKSPKLLWLRFYAGMAGAYVPFALMAEASRLVEHRWLSALMVICGAALLLGAAVLVEKKWNPYTGRVPLEELDAQRKPRKLSLGRNLAIIFAYYYLRDISPLSILYADGYGPWLGHLINYLFLMLLVTLTLVFHFAGWAAHPADDAVPEESLFPEA